MSSKSCIINHGCLMIFPSFFCLNEIKRIFDNEISCDL